MYDIQDDFLNSTRLCLLFGISIRSVDRWERDKALGFPQPVRINTHRFWRRSEVVEWFNSRRAK